MSEDNGTTWIRYGKNGVDTDSEGKELTYKKGKYTPQDFHFRCTVRTKDASNNATEQYATGVHELYLEPIYDNRITNVTIDYEGHGHENSTNDGSHMTFEISTDGDYWEEISPQTNGINLTNHESLDNYSNVLLVRVKMWRDTDKNVTPSLESLSITLTTDPSVEFYARSVNYTPPSDNMLGANIWGRLYAPFNMDNGVDCNVEIVEGTTVTNHFKLIGLSELDSDMINTYELDSNLSSFNDDGKASYLTVNTDNLEILKRNNIYIKPYRVENDSSGKLYLLSFSPSYQSDDMVVNGTKVEGTDTTETDEDNETVTVKGTYYEYEYNVGGLNFSRQVAYPIISVRKQDPCETDTSTLNVVDTFKEWIDYTFDYENNQLLFKQSTLDSELSSGDLYISYNPIFISRLTRDDVGRKIDLETNTVDEGLVLDYFKETITVSSTDIVNHRVSLRVAPVDPIREVRLYKYNRVDEDDYTSLYENWDYTLESVDAVNSLVFNVSETDGSSLILDEGDVLTVVYTPNIRANTLYVGYYATREDVSKQCRLENMYWEYKV
jgi:hypothetical protein